MTIHIGQMLGHYQIVEKLGEGGMATVYKAFDTRLERNVALKVLRTDKSESEVFFKRFEREAKSLAKLTHPNIVPIIDYGEEGGTPYLVMAYIPSGTLKDQLKEKGPIPWREAFQTVLPIAKALDHAHRHGILHRDVKPANILITEEGEPMLSDFGIAKLLEESDTTGLTSTGMGVGTPEYMAPEQLIGKTSVDDEDEEESRTHAVTGVTHPEKVKGKPKEEAELDGRADEYALGVVLFEMITGRKPYRADTPIAVALKQVTEPLPLPGKYVPDLPEQVQQVIMKAMAKSPADRYADMSAFSDAMQKTMGISEKTGQKKEKAAKPSKDVIGLWVKEKKNQKRLAIGGGIALLGIFVIGGFILLMNLISSGRRGMGPMNYLASRTPTPTFTATATKIPLPTQTLKATFTPTSTLTLQPSPTRTKGPPPIPGNFQVIERVLYDTGWCDVILEWDSVPGIDGYQLYINTAFHIIDINYTIYNYEDITIDADTTTYKIDIIADTDERTTQITLYFRSFTNIDNTQEYSSYVIMNTNGKCP